jgi:ubiquinone biosynthesis accessory factor UbiJ
VDPSERPVQLPVTLLAAIEQALNHYLALDPRALEQMAVLEGRVLGVELRGLAVTFYLLPGRGGVQVLGHYEGDADARLSGTPVALARLGLGANAPGMLFSGEVRIEGDTELGQTFRRILDDMDIDWEEQLARYTGDLVAHQVGRGLRAAAHWGGEAGRSLEQDVTEYLQEESRQLITEQELEGFLAGVDVARTDVDRLEARIKRLRRHLDGQD